MSTRQSIITILVIALGTQLTRFLPFVLFPEKRTPPPYISYLGRVLPYAAMGLLVVYCLRNAWAGAFYGLPELIAVACVAGLHVWKRNTLLSIGAGTALYMFLVQVCF